MAGELDDIVDCVAEIAVDLADCFGHSVANGSPLIFNNEDGTGDFSLSGYIDEGYSGSASLHGGQTDSQEINIIIPKQTNFPPASFHINTGSIVTANGTKYVTEDYSSDIEDMKLAATFTLICTRFNQDFDA